MKTNRIHRHAQAFSGRKWALLALLAAVITIVLMTFAAAFPSVALADITVGGTNIQGYNPSDIVSTDVEIGDGTIDSLGPMLASKVVDVVMKALPILAVASVVVLIYNAVRNMFLPDEDPHEARKAGRKPKRPMGQVLKDIFMMYFWILFAWIIVELIIYAVTHLETMASGSLTSSPSQQTTTQQVQQSQQTQQTQQSQQPVGGQTATPVGSGTQPVGGTTQPVGTTEQQPVNQQPVGQQVTEAGTVA